MEQRSLEWHIHRSDKIGASDFALFMANKGLCKNIYNKSLEMCFKDKLNINQTDNIYLNIGKTGEKYITTIINNVYCDGKYTDVQNQNLKNKIYYDNSRIMASLDFYDDEKDINIEIKITTKNKDDYLDNLEYYKYQVLHQAYCSNIKNNLLFVVFVDKKILNYSQTELENYFYNFKINKYNYYELFFNESTLNQILSKETWLNYCNEFLAKLDNYILSFDENNQDINLFNEYYFIDEKIKTLQEEKEIIKHKIKNKFNETAIFQNYKIQYNNIKICNYKKFIQDNNLKIPDNYFSNSSSFRIYKLK